MSAVDVPFALLSAALTMGAITALVYLARSFQDTWRESVEAHHRALNMQQVQTALEALPLEPLPDEAVVTVDDAGRYVVTFHGRYARTGNPKPPRDASAPHLPHIRGTAQYAHAWAMRIKPDDGQQPGIPYTPASTRELRVVEATLATRGLELRPARRRRALYRGGQDPWTYRIPYVVRTIDGAALPPRGI